MKGRVIILLIGYYNIVTSASSIESFTTLEQKINAIPKTVIKANSRTAKENARHQKYCAQQGEIDLTNKSNVTIGSGSSDAIICIGNKPVTASSPTAGSIDR